MKSLLPTVPLVAGSLAFGTPMGVAPEMPKLPRSWTIHFTTYCSVHPAQVVEMVEDCSTTVGELVGITRKPD